MSYSIPTLKPVVLWCTTDWVGVQRGEEGGEGEKKEIGTEGERE